MAQGELFKPSEVEIETGIAAVRQCQAHFLNLTYVVKNAIQRDGDPVPVVERSMDSLMSFDMASETRQVADRQCARVCYLGLLGTCPFGQRELSATEVAVLLGGFDEPTTSVFSPRDVTTTLIEGNLAVLLRGTLPRGNPVSRISRRLGEVVWENYSRFARSHGFQPPVPLDTVAVKPLEEPALF